TPCRNSILSGHEYVQELLNGNPDRIYDSFRMDKHVFLRLCQTLETLDLLHYDRHVGFQEAVHIFLFIVSHNIRMRVEAERFQRSKDTIHRQFKHVLTALCGLSPCIICPSSKGETPPEILNNPKYYPYFERFFGVLKARFPIFKLMPNYLPHRQRRIPIACCVLHNFIQREARRDRLFEEFQVDDIIVEGEDMATPNLDMSPENIAQMTNIRDKIAQDLWRDFTQDS
ncbi:hypothetical protein PRUPE_6G192900, partial [Prunus persica]